MKYQFPMNFIHENFRQTLLERLSSHAIRKNAEKIPRKKLPTRFCAMAKVFRPQVSLRTFSTSPKRHSRSPALIFRRDGGQ
jgi:hypothetical protein